MDVRTVGFGLLSPLPEGKETDDGTCYVKDGEVLLVHVIKFYREGGVRLNSFSSSLDGDEFSALPSGRFTPRKRASVPLQQEDVWCPEPVWKFWKTSPVRNLTRCNPTQSLFTIPATY